MVRSSHSLPVKENDRRPGLFSWAVTVYPHVGFPSVFDLVVINTHHLNRCLVCMDDVKPAIDLVRKSFVSVRKKSGQFFIRKPVIAGRPSRSASLSMADRLNDGWLPEMLLKCQNRIRWRCYCM